MSSRKNLLWPSLIGLVAIKDKVHSLKQYALMNNEDPEKEPDDLQFKGEKLLECKVKIAKPRTQEAKNFLGNV